MFCASSAIDVLLHQHLLLPQLIALVVLPNYIKDSLLDISSETSLFLLIPCEDVAFVGSQCVMHQYIAVEQYIWDWHVSGARNSSIDDLASKRGFSIVSYRINKNLLKELASPKAKCLTLRIQPRMHKCEFD